MAPATVTESETSLQDSDHYTDGYCKICEVNDRSETYYSFIQHRNSYEQPKNEWKFMSNIRSWEQQLGFKTPLRWMNAFFITAHHAIVVFWFLYYSYLGIVPKWQTIAFGFFMATMAGFGVTAGAHRYWCHRSYKAKVPLQLLLMYCYSVAGQNTIPEWVRDHRVHHKYSETSADPHDARRGFFFAHVGWLMMKKHPEVIRQGRKINMSDIDNDPIVQFYTQYFMLFKIANCFVLPSIVPALVWGETWEYAILSQAFLRYIASLNFTWSVNSFAHLWGSKPYDRYIAPAENWGVSLVALGEGWHNYHHTFPWDYKVSELGCTLNLTTFYLDMFAKIGWAYDLKQASPSLVQAIALKKGEIKDFH